MPKVAFSPITCVMKRKKNNWVEKNNALEGRGWTLQERFHNADEQFHLFLKLTPFSYKPFRRSFSSFRDYEKWKKRQTNPWFF